LIKIEFPAQQWRAVEILIGGNHGSRPLRHGDLSLMGR
jgi:hypothetical protein